jgi:uncharacterized protein (DUF1697 family)
VTAYVAFVRGVNVGGNKMLSSAALKEACESLGFADVKTHLNSGNVVFRAKKADAKKIENAIALNARVILRTAAELRAAIAANPFPDEAQTDPSHLLIQFLSGPLDAKAKALLAAYSGTEKLHCGEREVYVHYTSMADSKLNLLLTEKKIGVAATGRNWNTVNALLRLLEERE